MSVRERVLQLIEEKGTTQTAIAEQMGEPRTWLNNRLTGYTAIKADELPRIAGALGVSPCDFFAENDATPTPLPMGQPLSAQEQLMYDELRAFLGERFEEPAASAAATVIDFLRYQHERQQRDQQQQWRRQVEPVTRDTPERG